MSDLLWLPLLKMPRWLWALPVAVYGWYWPAYLPILLILALIAGRSLKSGFSGRSLAALLISIILTLGLATTVSEAAAASDPPPLSALALLSGALCCALLAGQKRRPRFTHNTPHSVYRPPSQQLGRLVRMTTPLLGIMLVLYLISDGTQMQNVILLIALLIGLELCGDAPRLLGAWGLSALPFVLLSGLIGVDGWLFALTALAALIMFCWPPRAFTSALVNAGLLGGGLGLSWVLDGGQSSVALCMAGIAPWSATMWAAIAPPTTKPHHAMRTLPPSWRWFVWGKRRWDPVCTQMLADQRAWGRILDAGCGWGLGALLAASRPGSDHYLGIDLDDTKLGIADHLLRQLPLPCQLRRAQLPTTIIDSELFDTIFAWDILHYWPAAEQQSLIHWLAQKLSTNGVLWLREGLRDAQGAQSVKLGERFTTAIGLNPRQALHFPSRDELEAAFSAAGLKVISCQSSGGANHLWQLQAADA